MSGSIEVEHQPIMPTNKEMLAEINKAILTILNGGQSYVIGSRRLVRADLAELYKMRKEFESLAAADETNGNGFFDDCYVAVWPWER